MHPATPLAGALLLAALMVVSQPPAAVAGGYHHQATAQPGSNAVTAVSLARTSGAVVYDCPAAGCSYESRKAGMCPTHKLKLQKMTLQYTCPKDGQPVAAAGRCPRCAMDAAEHRMAMMAEAQPSRPRHSHHHAAY